MIGLGVQINDGCLNILPYFVNCNQSPQNSFKDLKGFKV
jgi:hypothetical protein